MKRYFLFSIITLLLAVGFYFVNYYAFKVLYDSSVPFYLIFLIVYLFASNLLIHKFLINSSKKKSRTFVTYFMGAFSLKMLLAILLCLIPVVLELDYTKPMILSFAIMYLFFLFNEVLFIVKELKSVEEK